VQREEEDICRGRRGVGVDQQPSTRKLRRLGPSAVQGKQEDQRKTVNTAIHSSHSPNALMGINHQNQADAKKDN
jgi:hypothetical protein